MKRLIYIKDYYGSTRIERQEIGPLLVLGGGERGAFRKEGRPDVAGDVPDGAGDSVRADPHGATSEFKPKGESGMTQSPASKASEK